MSGPISEDAVNTRVAVDPDLAFLCRVDAHLSATDVARAVSEGRVLVADVAGAPVGFLRWGLLWDEVPFMNLLWLLPQWRTRGVGRALVRSWEDSHRGAGQRFVLTSTSAAEQAQHFYRRLGYTDGGALLLPDEPAELVLIKGAGRRSGPTFGSWRSTDARARVGVDA